MIAENLVRDFMRAAVGGVTRTQVIRAFKEFYGCSDEDIKEILNTCNFKKKPNKIDYNQFYCAPITRTAKRIYYPFTQIYAQNNLLTANECEDLIKIIDNKSRPSTISNPTDSEVVSDYRTSQTADLHYFDDSFYLQIDKKITACLGLDPFLGETAQAQRYEPGQYYKEHWDFFSPFTPEYKIYCEWMGQRTWTTMIYLNDVEEGGETYFKHLNLKIKPQKGTMIAWNNVYKNGIPNLKTLHEALPPVSGNKYVITKWFRSYSLI